MKLFLVMLLIVFSFEVRAEFLVSNDKRVEVEIPEGWEITGSQKSNFFIAIKKGEVQRETESMFFTIKDVDNTAVSIMTPEFKTVASKEISSAQKILQDYTKINKQKVILRIFKTSDGLDNKNILTYIYCTENKNVLYRIRTVLKNDANYEKKIDKILDTIRFVSAEDPKKVAENTPPTEEKTNNGGSSTVETASKVVVIIDGQGGDELKSLEQTEAEIKKQFEEFYKDVNSPNKETRKKAFIKILPDEKTMKLFLTDEEYNLVKDQIKRHYDLWIQYPDSLVVDNKRVGKLEYIKLVSAKDRYKYHEFPKRVKFPLYVMKIKYENMQSETSYEPLFLVNGKLKWFDNLLFLEKELKNFKKK